jgi:hypothetical protein
MHAVVEMPQFRSDVKSAGLSDQQRVAIIDRLALEPMAGDLIPGSGALARFGLPVAAKARAAAIG